MNVLKLLHNLLYCDSMVENSASRTNQSFATREDLVSLYTLESMAEENDERHILISHFDGLFQTEYVYDEMWLHHQ